MIEPRPDDYEMAFYNSMRYSSRLTVGPHRFEAVTLDLAKEFPTYKEILARHGIHISRRMVIQELAEIQNSGYNSGAIQMVFGNAPDRVQPRGTQYAIRPIKHSSLAQLDIILDQMGAAGS